MENEIVKYKKTAEDIDIICGSVPQAYTGFAVSFAMANAIRGLREIFDKPEVKELVESMCDTRLGFRTDQRDGDGYRKPVKYTWPEIREAVIEAMLTGYRITGNEFNIIGKNMYPTKEGKYRKIIEFPGLTGFMPTTTPAQYDQEERTGYKKQIEMVQFAKVQCFATWKVNGVAAKIGYGDDRLVFKIKVNAGMGDDAVIGKALSKLYTRVLMRLTGSSVPESEDLDAPETEIIPDGQSESWDTVNLADIAGDDNEPVKPKSNQINPTHLVCRTEECGAYAGLKLLSGCEDPNKWADGENSYIKNARCCEEFTPAKISGLFKEIGRDDVKKARKVVNVSEISRTEDQWMVYEAHMGVRKGRD